MSYVGDYKISGMLVMNDEKNVIEFKAIEKILEENADDPSIQKDAGMMIHIEEEKAFMGMAIPDDVPQEEIDKIVASGKAQVLGRMLLMDELKIKIENGDLYYFETSSFMRKKADEPWVKANTEVEGQLQIMTSFFQKI